MSSPPPQESSFTAWSTRTSPAGAWGAEGFNVEGVTCCFCGLVFVFRVFDPFLLDFTLFWGCFSDFSIISLGILRYFFVFWVLSSVFSMFSVGFRCISITLAATNRPDCALRLPEAKRHRQSFHQHTQIWSTNTRDSMPRYTTFLGEFWVIHPLVSCIPEITGFTKRFPKLREIDNVLIFLSLVFDPGNCLSRFASVSEPVYSRALFQSELV